MSSSSWWWWWWRGFRLGLSIFRDKHHVLTIKQTKKQTLKPTRTVRMTRAVCNAQQKKAAVPALGLAAAAVIATGALAGPVGPAHADISGLTKCSKNKAFAKREKKEIKDLERRQKLYEEGSAP